MNPEKPTLDSSQALIDQRIASREQTLRALLGTDYDYAHESGLIDMFYYDPETGQDGLVHILGGETMVSDDGKPTYGGFHHEPSGAIVWPKTDEEGHPVTRVDRDHLEGAKSSTRSEFVEWPFEPYKAKVAINGIAKMGVGKDKKTGEVIPRAVHNTMYPKEYDAIAVMQALRIAVETRDTSQDYTPETNDTIIVNKETRAPFINIDESLILPEEMDPADAELPKLVVGDKVAVLEKGNSLKVRIILDKNTNKIINAIPVIDSSKMKLTPEEAEKHLGL